MIHESTGYKTKLLAGHGFIPLFHHGAILLFDTPFPDSADDPLVADPCGAVTIDGYDWEPGVNTGFGLTFRQIGALITKDVGSWVLRSFDDTTVVWARLVTSTEDVGSYSDEAARIDFTVSAPGLGPAPLILPTTTIVSGQSIRIDWFEYRLI